MGAGSTHQSAGCCPCLFPGGSRPGHPQRGGWGQCSGGCSCMDVNVLGTPGKLIGLPGHPSCHVPAAPPSPPPSLWCTREPEHRVVPCPCSEGPGPACSRNPAQNSAPSLRSRQPRPPLRHPSLMLSLELLQGFSFLSTSHHSASSSSALGSRFSRSVHAKVKAQRISGP